MKYHYTREDVYNALQEIGLKKGDTVFSHSNIGYLGIPQGGRDIDNAFNTILNAFFDVIGSEGTLIVPTYTYSFPQNKIFNPDETPSDCGIFTEKLRQHKDAYRSEDPCVSVAAIGKRAIELTTDAPQNTYGPNSFFHRLHKAQAIICNINFDAGSNFVHYVERVLHVPYRFDKTFTGILQKNGKIIKTSSTLWVRYLVPGTHPQFEKYNKLAVEKNLFKISKVGRGMFGAISTNDSFDLVKETLDYRPWFLTDAEELGIIPEINPCLI